jgi:hypothetical protein
MKLTTKQVLLLAAEASADPRTVKSIYAGKKSQALVRERVGMAAKKLKMPAPPKGAAQ